MEREGTDWRLVMLLWAAGLGAAAQYGKISVIFDRLPEVYPDAGASLGFAVSLVGFLGILLGVIAGVLVARIGYRRALLSALVLGAGISVFQGLFPALPLFLGSRVLEGAAHLAIVVAGPTMIAEFSDAKGRGLALTIWSSFFAVAFAVLAWVGIPLAQAFGLRSLMWAHAVYMAVMAAVLWPILPKVSGERPRPPRLAELVTAHRRIYFDPFVGAAAWGWLFYTTCFVAVLTVLPPYLPEGSRALVLGLMPLMSLGSSLTLGVLLLRRVEAVKVSIAGFVCCAVASVGLWVLPGNPVLFLALGAALGLVQGSGFALVPQLNQVAEDRALANGGMAQTGNLGNTVGTPLLVAVIGLAGYGGLPVVLALLFVGGAVAHLVLKRRRGGHYA
ncbi:MFS transporter [Pseudoruegeria sp. HB172150]|uniref:MFS transporter n=1 Tax=Pseudoruegeria sp. HB172150 TaxID=2721164 RepID=UPI001556E917|nr:MFS transporter [Pseudoruegeria sp. HB172150]